MAMFGIGKFGWSIPKSRCVPCNFSRRYPANYLITSLPPYKPTLDYAILREVWASLYSELTDGICFGAFQVKLVRRPLKNLKIPFFEVFTLKVFTPSLHLLPQIVTNFSLLSQSPSQLSLTLERLKAPAVAVASPGDTPGLRQIWVHSLQQVSRRRRPALEPTLATLPPVVRSIFLKL